MEYEAGGYPATPTGIPPEPWRLVVAAGRASQSHDPSTNELKWFGYTESIAEMEETIRAAQASLTTVREPEVTISDLKEYYWTPQALSQARQQRATMQQTVAQTAKRLASRRAFIYAYASKRHHELKFSGIADDAFDRIRRRVDSTIGELIPTAAQRFTAIHDYLHSGNTEDWSNAVTSSRRLLQDLADAVFPATDQARTVEVDGKPKTIKLGVGNYKNRIMASVQDNSTSDRFGSLVGSHLGFLGDRLDAVYEAANKGAHTTIVSREEADRYVVYTYLLIGDVLSLRAKPPVAPTGAVLETPSAPLELPRPASPN